MVLEGAVQDNATVCGVLYIPCGTEYVGTGATEMVVHAIELLVYPGAVQSAPMTEV
jgi:hypothetical protein